MVEEAYKTSVHWGMQPEQFWRLAPLEWWWQFDARFVGARYGSLTEDQVAELYEALQERGKV